MTTDTLDDALRESPERFTTEARELRERWGPYFAGLRNELFCRCWAEHIWFLLGLLDEDADELRSHLIGIYAPGDAAVLALVDDAALDGIDWCTENLLTQWDTINIHLHRNTHLRAVRLLACQAVASGAPVHRAVEAAAQDVVFKRFWFLAGCRVPYRYAPVQVEWGLAEKRRLLGEDGLDEAESYRLEEDGGWSEDVFLRQWSNAWFESQFHPQRGPGHLTCLAYKGRFIEMAATFGVWKTRHDDTGVELYIDAEIGGEVMKGGLPLFYSFRELEDLGQALMEEQTRRYFGRDINIVRGPYVRTDNEYENNRNRRLEKERAHATNALTLLHAGLQA